MWANKFHLMKDNVLVEFFLSVSDPTTSIIFAASSVNALSLVKIVVQNQTQTEA